MLERRCRDAEVPNEGCDTSEVAPFVTACGRAALLAQDAVSKDFAPFCELLDDQQLLEPARQRLAAACTYDHHIFDPAAQLVRDEDARLDGETHALL